MRHELVTKNRTEIIAALEGFTARIPVRRMGTPDDMAKAVLFLASAAAGCMAGASIVVDGVVTSLVTRSL